MSIFRNRDEILSHGNIEGRRIVLDILDAGIEAGDPYPNVRKAIWVEGNKLYVGTEDFPPGPLGFVPPTRPRTADTGG